MNEVVDAQLEKHKVELQHVKQAYRQQSLGAETAIQQRDAALAEMRRDSDRPDRQQHDPTPDAWYVKNPGPDRMQQMAGATPTRNAPRKANLYPTE